MTRLSDPEGASSVCCHGDGTLLFSPTAPSVLRTGERGREEGVGLGSTPW